MTDTVGVRELRQNLSRYLERVKAGEDLVVSEHGRVVARLVPAGGAADAYAELSAQFGSTIPIEPLEVVAAQLKPPDAPAGTTDAYLEETRSDRV